MKIFIIIFSTIILISCGKPKNDTQHDKNELSNSIKEAYTHFNEAQKKMSTKYNIFDDWLKLSYTYEMQEKFIENELNYLAFQGHIIDIIKTDSSYYLKIFSQSSPYSEFANMALVTISAKEFFQIKEKIPKPNNLVMIGSAYVIIKLSKIYQKSPVLETEIYDDEVTKDVNFYFNSGKNLRVLEGVFIDCCFLELPSSASKLTQ